MTLQLGTYRHQTYVHSISVTIEGQLERKRASILKYHGILFPLIEAATSIKYLAF